MRREPIGATYIAVGLLCGLIVIVLCAFVSHAEPLKTPLPLPSGSFSILEEMTMFEDASGTLDAQRILKPDCQAQFKPASGEALSLGWTNSTYWFRLPLDCASLAHMNQEGPVRWNLMLGWTYFSRLDVYRQTENRLTPATPTDTQASPGIVEAFRKRILPVCSDTGVETYYVRAWTDRSFFFAPRLCSESECITSTLSFWTAFVITIGIIATMTLYNLFIFSYVKDAAYAWYILYHLCSIFYLILRQWSPLNIPYSSFLIPVVFNIGTAAVTMFARHFFELWKRNHLINAVSVTLASLLALLVIGGPFLSRLQHQILSALLGSTCVGVNIIAAVYCLRRGVTAARFFIFAWAVTGAVSILYACAAAGLLPFIYYQSIGYSIALESLIMSLALAYRIQLMRMTQEEAEAANQAKVSFLAKISHDIRTPLNAIIGFTHVALQHSTPPQVRSFLERIRTAANSQLALVNDILDFSKIEVGKLEIESKPFDLHAVLQEIADVAAEKAKANNNELIFVTDSNIPTHYLGDPGRLGQALGNLINNSLKFTKNGHVVVRVEHRNYPANKDDPKRIAALTFTVTDNGIGIDASKLPLLFQSFTQADSSIAHNFGGSGLGLSICKGLVEAMGGQVWAKSELHEGSTFGFTVPLQINGLGKKDRLIVVLSGLRVLVVSRPGTIRSVTAEIMRSFGFNADQLSPGAYEVQMIQNHTEPYAIVVVDDTTLEEEPNILRSIRGACPPGTEVLVLTSLDLYDALNTESDLSGAKLYAAKPLTPLSLFRTIMDALGEKEAVQAVEEMSADEVEARRLLKGTRILVVEDNQFNQEVAWLILNEVGVEVTIAENGEVAVADLLGQSPSHYDAVIMDMVMPVMGGVEAATQIRKYHSFQRLPIVAMTANAMKGDSEACLNAGMNAHISKPIDTRELLVTLARCIGEARTGKRGERG